jgi:hypothetical protein
MAEPAGSPARPNVFDPVAWGALLLAALFALGQFAWFASQRLPYPHELEWMEGALVDHAHRVAQGLPLYCAPTPEHVPFLYAPLLFWLGALGMKLGLPGLLALRLVAALASLGTALLLGHWVRRESGRVVPGLVASGLFLAAYGWLHWWFDLARNDALFLLPTLGCAYLLRHGGRWRWLPAAVLALVAVLAKQSALMWLPAIGVGALLHDGRTALRFAGASVVLLAVGLGGLHLGTEGWSTFYLFEMPRQHAVEGKAKLGFWTQDLLPLVPLQLLGFLGFVERWRRGERPAALFLAAVGSGGLVTSWLSRLHVGGFHNVLMYGFAAACLLGPLAVVAAGRVARVAVPVLLLTQFAVLFGYSVAREPERTALPSTAHQKAHDSLLAYVRGVTGDVLIPGHGGITIQAGKTTGAHGQAIFDLLQALPKTPDGGLDLLALADDQRLGQLPGKTGPALRSFRDGVLQALLARRFGAIVLDQQIGAQFEGLFAFGLLGPDGRIGTPDDLYRRRTAPLLEDGPALRPLVGFPVDSPYALEALR